MKTTQLLVWGLWILSAVGAGAQNYTRYQTGDTSDVQAAAQGGVCLMGGSVEDDEAMRWFLRRAGGGDVLVLRASGSDGYNDYLYTDLGESVHSVETIVCHNAQCAQDAYVQRRIREAEAIWFAGGNQWNYVNYWRGTAVDSLINEGIEQRNIVVGGTSAGMAILGGRYFTAQNGTVSSTTALANPFDAAVTVDTAAFLRVPQMANVLTDTHFDNPDRRGRFAVFFARLFADFGVAAQGIACDESVAVCIDTAGMARVFGVATAGRAYFVQHSCVPNTIGAELCAPMQPLHWYRAGAALLVYAVDGSSTGANTFDLTAWQTGTGGEWQHWAVDDGVWQSQTLAASPCAPIAVAETTTAIGFSLAPNPADGLVHLQFDNSAGGTWRLFDATGRIRQQQTVAAGENQATIDISTITAGIYLLEWSDAKGSRQVKKLVKGR